MRVLEAAVFGCSALVAVGVLLVLRKYPVLHWPAVLLLTLVTSIGLVAFGQRNELPRVGLGLGVCLFFVGPLAVTLAAFRMPFLRWHSKLIYVLAPAAFVIGILAWVFIAVNLGYLIP